MRWVSAASALAIFLAACVASSVRSQPTSAADVHLFAAGAGHTLRLELQRWDDGTITHPFTLDVASAAVSLVGANGAVYRLASRESGTLASMHAIGYNVIKLTDEYAASVPPGMYGVRLNAVALRDADNAAVTLAQGMFPDRLYVPARDDATLARLREQYVGKTVHGYLGVVLPCLGAAESDVYNAASARVASITRPLGGEFRTIGSGGDDYYAFDPLVVSFTDPSGSRLAGVMISGPAFGPNSKHRPSRPGAGRPHCGTYKVSFSDAWDVARTITFRSSADHSEWSPAIRSAIAKGEPRIGMTHEMVAYVWGFPTTYDTAGVSVRALEARADWMYPAGAPFARSVRFRGDRVVSFRAPGNLP